MAERIARMATMHTISRSVKPSSAIAASSRPAGDISCRSGSTFLTIRAIRHDVVGPMLPRRAIDVSVAPWVVGNDCAFQVRTIPRHRAARTLHQRRETLRAGRVASIVEEVQIERAREALDLNLGGLGLGFGQVVE